MKLLKLVPQDTNIRFIRYRIPAAIFSAAMILMSLGIFFTLGVNKGIDFEGGILIEVGSEAPAELAVFRSALAGQGFGDVAVQAFGTENEVLIRIERQPAAVSGDMSRSEIVKAEEEAQQQAVLKVQDALGAVIQGLSYRRVEFVGPKVSGELVEAGVLAVLVAVGAVLLYIWFRFEWHFGVGAVIALLHDVVLTLGFFSLTRLEFNLSIVAAILTIVGYSLNDTVVVYDRIRENLRKFRNKPIPELLDLSLNGTLSRTIMTSITTLIVLGSLFFFGGAVIKGFTAAMIWGVFVGTYSSVFIAAPVLLYFKLDRSHMAVGEGAGRNA
jgi:preprotein translocase SecF subunit